MTKNNELAAALDSVNECLHKKEASYRMRYIQKPDGLYDIEKSYSGSWQMLLGDLKKKDAVLSLQGIKIGMEV